MSSTDCHRVAIDIGGTFTDLVTEDEGGALWTTKVLSTPPNLVEGVLDAMRRASVRCSTVELFVHGTTQGLNALIERRGARVALVTTGGFGDTYLLGRCHRPDMYNLRYKKPSLLLDREAIFEVTERLNADGSVHVPVDATTVANVAELIRAGAYEVIAICLLHSFLNGAHEEEVARQLQELLPDVPTITSHQVAPEWREYERTSTTVMSAYITPIMRAYLDQLESLLRTAGLTVPVYINESNGGVMVADIAGDHAVGTLMSGPVGGVVGTAALADVIDERDLISADVGGTSFDVSIVRDGRPSVRAEFEMQGLPVLAPSVEVHTIGAGGGSLIVVDGNGRLRVGPESAGAVPGPACYGRGGTAPTVTDAHVVVGNLPRVQKLAGSLELDGAASHAAMAAAGALLGLTDVELAQQALQIINFRMAESIRELTTERGIDPRGFVLCCFGGAGGLHAADVADELEIKRVVVPALPGSFSAAGMLKGGVQHDLVQSFLRSHPDAERDIDVALTALRQRGETMLAAESVPHDEAYFRFFADVRYVGQEYSMTVPVRQGAPFQELVDEFQDVYHGRYGHSSPGAGIELVAVRARVGRAFDQRKPVDTPSIAKRPIAEQLVRFADGPLPAPIYLRDDVVEVGGPALILEATSTTIVPPHWSARRLPGGHLMLERKDT